MPYTDGGLEADSVQLRKDRGGRRWRFRVSHFVLGICFFWNHQMNGKSEKRGPGGGVAGIL